ncbi:BolA/IbaG family iron-sulfur metabolism protein [Roseobacter sp. HKCCA0434]|uniref:BolA/IbaG family iron-sulfur metabolism protein n=1 Tax=Roseobacter sp. HKCCA0434 TaxID=3079297 RepID=UPI002905C073|nr:BolA/IbaG family iron-sulfur metabolism protein [Roseobacter sp. HKCCA0434]
MSMKAHEIEALIREAFPTAEIRIDDLAGDDNHFAATVIAEEFKGLNRVKQQQAVYAAMKGRVGNGPDQVHALALTTKVPG